MTRDQYCRTAGAEVEGYNEPSVNSSHVNGEYAKINWDVLGFGLIPTDYMYIMNCSKDQHFSQGTLTPFGKIEVNPSSGILNYGQGLFEGLKAHRTANGRILLFRPEENAMRMKVGAKRMCMQAPTVEQFVNAVKQTVHSNKRWVPPPGKGAMYIRPLLMGSGPVLGVAPASEYTFITYASPVGNYHKGVLNLIVEEKFRRAIPGGTGGVKAVTNYAIIYKPIAEAKAKGFTDVLFLNAEKYIEEVSTTNIFLVKGNEILTPPTSGTILPGITRKSIIEITHVLGYQTTSARYYEVEQITLTRWYELELMTMWYELEQITSTRWYELEQTTSTRCYELEEITSTRYLLIVKERAIPVGELFDAEEVFCTGTAVGVNSVNSITYQDTRIAYKRGAGTVGQKLYEMLTGIQTGRIEDKMGWTVELD
ncbi:putative branched-chain-amino-acid aminotransferase 7 [Citrus sinensis]|uniref:Branched-chain-amino-acid aminotransferase 7 n=1 Tax=Citrus sinensis TaxID=2711 RepID=A0ACB8IDU8_CITSI|nr:putative branched-chain-amino-acid aminotransferase 7 [Citrus sinensis]